MEHFFMDVIFAAKAGGGHEYLFADDLSVFQDFDRHENDEHVMSKMEYTRKRVHEWGKRNRVALDASKENIVCIPHIWHSERAFQFLGVAFDSNLNMA